MVGACGWAFIKPIRKLYYNLTITFVSIIAALVVAGFEMLGLVRELLGLKGALWNIVGGLSANFGSIGYLVIAVFVLSWIVSMLFYRIKGFDRPEVLGSSSEQNFD
jgi:high-affinity nickel-transport protein